MSTAEETGRYVIQPRADELLGELSNDFSEVIISMAAQLSPERTAHNVPIITVCGIAAASNLLCSLITDAIKSGKATPEGQTALLTLKAFCEKVNTECAGGAGPTSPH